MYRNSPDRSSGRGRHTRENREKRDRHRSRSSSQSPPGKFRKHGKQDEKRDGEYKGRDDEVSRRSFHGRSRASPRSRSPRHRRERARSDSSSEENSRKYQKTPHEPHKERRPRYREDHDDRNRHRDREYRSQRRYRERSGSKERNHSPQRHTNRDSHRRVRPDADPSMRSTDTQGEHLGEAPPPVEKEQPNYGRSGKLAAETNRVEGTKIVLKYHEPPEARLPPASNDWRMYEFKDKETISTTELSKRSCWLIGREEAIVDFPVAHPSCSSQHAVLQFRFVEKKNEYGERIGKVKLYVLDLESSNGTILNGERIEDRRFIEVRHGDVARFGESTREYVFLLA